MSDAAVIVSNVTHRFGDSVLAIANATLSIKSGEFISIVGPSGCGKTTLLNLIAGIVAVTQGRIKVFGESPKEGRADTAYMLARDGLLPWLSAYENATFGASIRGIDATRTQARATRLLESVGLAGFGNAYPKQLSHGMRQRVALARTFCLDSPLLLMDEPFGALDAQTKLQLEEVLLQLWSEERRTVIFITHDLAEAIALSDRVIVMSKRPGRIIADIPVSLHRPRSIRELQKDTQFHHLYSQVWSTLELALSGEGETLLAAYG
jgi:NitT/TauT family transport system ATP-binding protein